MFGPSKPRVINLLGFAVRTALLNNFEYNNFIVSERIILESFWDDLGMIWGSIWDQFGINLGSIWDRFGIDLGSIWDQFGTGRDY